MPNESQEKKAKINLSKQELAIFESLNKQAEELGLTVRQLELLVQAVQTSAIDTAGAMADIAKKMAEGGANAKEITQELEEQILDIAHASEEMSKDMEFVVEVYDQLPGVVNDSVDALKNVNVETDAIQSTLIGVTENMLGASAATDELNESIGQSSGMLTPFNLLQDKVNNAFNKTGDLLTDVSGIIGNITADSYDLLSVADGSNKSYSDSVDLLGTEQKLAKSTLLDLADQVKKLEEQVELKEKSGELQKDSADMMKASLLEYRSELNVQKLLLQTEEAKLQIIRTSGEEYRLGTMAIIESGHAMQSAIEGFVGSLPGGDFLIKQFGLDKISDAIEGNITESFGTFVELAATDGVASFGALSGAVTSFGRGLVVALGPIGIIAGIAAGLAMLMVDIDHSTHEISENMGVGHAAAKGILKDSYKIQASLSNRLGSHEDILAIMGRQIELSGMTLRSNDKTIAQLASIGNQMGYGAEQAANFHDAPICN